MFGPDYEDDMPSDAEIEAWEEERYIENQIEEQMIEDSIQRQLEEAALEPDPDDLDAQFEEHLARED